MKTAHCCFPTALTKLRALPDDLNGILQFNGEIFKENGENKVHDSKYYMPYVVDLIFHDKFTCDYREF